MLDENPADESTTSTPDESGATGAEETAAPPPRKRAARKTTKSAASKTAAAEPAPAEPAEAGQSETAGTAESKPTVTKTVRKTTARRTTKKAAAAPAEELPVEGAPADVAPDVTPVAEEKPAPRKRAARKTAAAKPAASETPAEAPEVGTPEAGTSEVGTSEAGAPAKKAPAKRTRKKAVAAPAEQLPFEAETPVATAEETEEEIEARLALEAAAALAPSGTTPSTAPQTALLFQAPDPTKAVRRPRKAAAKKTAAPAADAPDSDEAASQPAAAPATAEGETPDAPAPRKRSRRRPAAETTETPEPAEPTGDVTEAPSTDSVEGESEDQSEAAPSQPRTRSSRRGGRAARPAADVEDESDDSSDDDTDTDDNDTDNDTEGGSSNRRRRRRGGRRRRKTGDDASNGDQDSDDQDGEADSSDAEPARGSSDNDDQQESGEGGTSRRRRRRRRAGDDSGGENDEPENTVTRVRRPRSAEDEITSISGSTRLEAKKQRRRDGREAGRRRAPIVSEAEFLARRESVDRVMVIRQRGDLTQIGVLEDKVLVEHYVARESQTSLIGNVYLGRVQNVLPSMEAAFVDIGKGRNAVLYAGEVNWSSLGHKDNQPRKIESVLSSGQSILVQVTKDPIGHKGARLTSQVSLAGRFLVYVPDGTTSGISRKLPDTERSRLKALLKEIVPEGAGVIVRTAAEGASEEELTRDVERLTARWKDIESKTKGSSPQMLYGEPDLTLKVVRDLFTEDFSKLVIQGDDAWETVQNYVSHVAPDLVERLERYDETQGPDIFATYRVDEQIAKGLDRKVWLPSGGSLVIDRTEAMTVVDVNTGKFTGSGGNLEETVTKNNLEAAEEIVRQLRLRDIGGIIVVDFIDMVLESNRDLVLRRLVECLGRDRTKHQVAEVTSLGLVQMTRKRIGTGLVESFSENCDHCQGRGVVIHDAPVEPRGAEDEGRRGARRSRGGKGRDSGGDNRGDTRGSDGGAGGGSGDGRPVVVPTPKDIAAVARPENAEKPPVDEAEAPEAPSSTQPAADEPAGSGAGVTTETEAPQVRTRSRRSRGRGGANRAEQAESPEAESAPEPAAQSVAQPAAQPVAQPEAPVAAEPAPVVAPEPVPSEARPEEVPEPTPVGTSQVTTRVVRTRRAPRVVTTAPVAVKVQEQPDPTSVAEAPLVTPPAPKVVTRTRGRRTATPGAGSGSGEGGETGAESGDDTPHVPVKNKGARKR